MAKYPDILLPEGLRPDGLYVRKGTGSPAYDPMSFAPDFWWQPTLAATAGTEPGQEINQLTESGGIGRVWDRGADNGPTVQLVNGKRRARFIHTSTQSLTAATNPWTGASALYLLWLVKSNGGGGVETAFHRLWQTNTTHYPWADDNVYDDTGTSVRQAFTPGAGVLATERLYEIISDGTTWSAYLDGVLAHTAAIPGLGTPNPLPIIGKSGSYSFSGDIGLGIGRRTLPAPGARADLLAWAATQ